MARQWRVVCTYEEEEDIMFNLPQKRVESSVSNSMQNSDIPRLFMRKDVKEWNKTAIDCFQLGCNCSKCFIYHTYFKDKYYTCKMKYYVQLMLEKLGEPKVDDDFI